MAEERKVEFDSKWCPHTCLQCRTDCVCCHWNDEKKVWYCGWNQPQNIIYRKKEQG